MLGVKAKKRRSSFGEACMSFDQKPFREAAEQQRRRSSAIAPQIESVSVRRAMQAAAEATRRGEWCAWIDTGRRFSPSQAAAQGLLLRQLLWVHCAEHESAGALNTEARNTLRHVTSKRMPAAAVRQRGSCPAFMAKAWQAVQLLLRTGHFAVIVLAGARAGLASLRRQDRLGGTKMQGGEVLLLRPAQPSGPGDEDAMPSGEIGGEVRGAKHRRTAVCPIDVSGAGPYRRDLAAKTALEGKLLPWPHRPQSSACHEGVS